MTPAEYKAEREKRGSQAQVAAELGIHPMTISKRERGAKDAPITQEASIALTSLNQIAELTKRIALLTAERDGARSERNHYMAQSRSSRSPVLKPSGKIA